MVTLPLATVALVYARPALLRARVLPAWLLLLLVRPLWSPLPPSLRALLLLELLPRPLTHPPTPLSKT